MIDSYKTLSVGKYMEIRELLKQDLEEIELQTEIIAILKDTTPDEVLKLTVPEYSECVRKTGFLMEKPKPKAECPKKITIGGNKYYVLRKAEDLTAAQYIDYQNYMKMDDPDSKLGEILSVFIIPEGKKYGDGYDIQDVIADIKEHLSIQVAFGVCFFFRKKQIESIKRTLIYLELMMKIWKRKAKTEEQKTKMEEAERQMKLLRDLVGNGDYFIG